MADLSVTGSSTYSAGPIDTYTALSNGNNGSEILAEHIMGALDAVTKVESALGTGNAIKGNKSTLAARLDQMISADGGVGNGTAFPSSPTPVNGQLFFRTDLKQLYIYDSALASWSRIDGVNDHGLLGGLGDDDHPQYLRTDGVVPLARMQRTEASAQSGAVTVTSSDTSVITLSLGTVNSGDRILVTAWMRATKGATGGTTLMYVGQSAGTATITTLNSEVILKTSMNVPASSLQDQLISGVIKVTGTGTLTLRITGNSAGSDSSVPSGGSQVHAIVLNNG